MNKFLLAMMLTGLSYSSFANEFSCLLTDGKIVSVIINDQTVKYA